MSTPIGLWIEFSSGTYNASTNPYKISESHEDARAIFQAAYDGGYSNKFFFHRPLGENNQQVGAFQLDSGLYLAADSSWSHIVTEFQAAVASLRTNAPNAVQYHYYGTFVGQMAVLQTAGVYADFKSRADASIAYSTAYSGVRVCIDAGSSATYTPNGSFGAQWMAEAATALRAAGSDLLTESVPRTTNDHAFDYDAIITETVWQSVLNQSDIFRKTSDANATYRIATGNVQISWAGKSAPLNSFMESCVRYGHVPAIDPRGAYTAQDASEAYETALDNFEGVGSAARVTSSIAEVARIYKDPTRQIHLRWLGDGLSENGTQNSYINAVRDQAGNYTLTFDADDDYTALDHVPTSDGGTRTDIDQDDLETLYGSIGWPTHYGIQVGASQARNESTTKDGLDFFESNVLKIIDHLVAVHKAAERSEPYFILVASWETGLGDAWWSGVSSRLESICQQRPRVSLVSLYLIVKGLLGSYASWESDYLTSGDKHSSAGRSLFAGLLRDELYRDLSCRVVLSRARGRRR